MDYLLHQLLESSARANPASRAVSDRGRDMTYAELNDAANRVAHLLLNEGIARGDRVGLYLDKSLESVVGIYGVLKAGAAYVPLDPQAPVARLAYIATNCDMRCILTGIEKRTVWEELAKESTTDTFVTLNGDADRPGGLGEDIRVLGISDIRRQSREDPRIGTIDLDLAYILYTSGSTGAPKGVMLSHLNALSFVNWAAEGFNVGRDDILSSHAPLHFDLSIFDLFVAAKAGAAVVIVPPETSYFPIEVVKFIERNEITVWYSVPSILSMMVMRGGMKEGQLPTLKTMLFAGEVFPTKYLRRLMKLVPHARFVNLYGPTETNVCTFYEVRELEEGQDAPIPIGKAIANVEVFAVTEEGKRGEPGEVGELLVRGTTVMQGYWGDSARTQKSLIANPLGAAMHDPAYRTGDLVRQEPSGDYRLLGRRDHQIKSRGYRIELGEIESALYSHPSVLECCVIAVPDEMVTNKIKAYVVTRDEVGYKDLVDFCSERIPRYMIPESFDLRTSLPKTSTGKIDRQALSAVARGQGEGDGS